MNIHKNYWLAPETDSSGEGGSGVSASTEQSSSTEVTGTEATEQVTDKADSGHSDTEQVEKASDDVKKPTSAFSSMANQGSDGDGKDGEDTEEGETVDLSKMSDEEWAKAVQPDGENGEVPDRTLVTALAQVSRENGVTPQAMQKIMTRFSEVMKERNDEHQAAIDKDALELQEKAINAFDKNGWASIHAASSKYIKQGSMLDNALRNTVLGSDIEFLTILKSLGSTLRSDASPGTATTGSGSSPDHRLFMRTVPAHLR